MKNQKGSITPALLIITGAFMTIIYSLLITLSLQLNFSNRQVASEQALSIAEAGIDYYRWQLAHAPEDFNSSIHTYLDPQGGEIGEFSLTITPPAAGSSIITIQSTGKTFDYPNITRTIKVQYGKKSFSEYTVLQNASSWYGPGTVINGDIYSNNGIRMDGINTGLVMSARETYKCGSETGCSPPQWRPGVWGSGSDANLWIFPVAAIDFDSISFDYNEMRQASQDSGLYLGESGDYGYHLVFSNGDVTVNRVTETDYYKGYIPTGGGLGAQGKGGCRKRYQNIINEEYIGTYNINDLSIIFSEDHLWIEGTISGRITVVAAGFPITSQNMNIWIMNNLVYESYDGSSVLGLIAQNDIYFTRDVPNDFRIDGALMAQNGGLIRHGYLDSCGDATNAIRDKLTINGSFSSNLKSYWNFGTDPLLSGFNSVEINHDPNLTSSPPAFFPTTGDYQIISWVEE